MKKIFLIMLLFCMLLTHAEEAYDGETGEAYFPFFEKEALLLFQYVVYPEKSGLLLSAYSDDCEIAVTVEEDEEAADEKAFLQNYIKGISRYAYILNDPEIITYDEHQITGAKTEIVYRSQKAKEGDEGYQTDAFSMKTEENRYLLIVFNSWGEDGESAIRDIEERFFESFELQKREVSDSYLAFLKFSREDEEGNLYAVLDFCSVVYDESIFTVYAQNKTIQETEYRISKDALIWAEDVSSALYSAHLIDPTAQNLNEAAAYYYENMGFDIIFQVKFNEKGEIVWMMHYNAF